MGYLPISPGVYNIEVRNDDEVLISLEGVEIEEDQDYSVLAVGSAKDGSKNPPSLVALQDENNGDEGLNLRVVHVSPDAPKVDVLLKNKEHPEGFLISGVGFAGAQEPEFAAIPAVSSTADPYSVEVYVSPYKEGASPVIPVRTIAVESNSIYTVFIAGLLSSGLTINSTVADATGTKVAESVSRSSAYSVIGEDSNDAFFRQHAIGATTSNNSSLAPPPLEPIGQLEDDDEEDYSYNGNGNGDNDDRVLQVGQNGRFTNPSIPPPDNSPVQQQQEDEEDDDLFDDDDLSQYFNDISAARKSAPISRSILSSRPSTKQQQNTQNTESSISASISSSSSNSNSKSMPKLVPIAQQQKQQTPYAKPTLIPIAQRAGSTTAATNATSSLRPKLVPIGSSVGGGAAATKTEKTASTAPIAAAAQDCDQLQRMERQCSNFIKLLEDTEIEGKKISTHLEDLSAHADITLFMPTNKAFSQKDLNTLQKLSDTDKRRFISNYVHEGKGLPIASSLESFQRGRQRVHSFATKGKRLFEFVGSSISSELPKLVGVREKYNTHMAFTDDVFHRLHYVVHDAHHTQLGSTSA